MSLEQINYKPVKHFYPNPLKRAPTPAEIVVINEADVSENVVIGLQKVII